MSINDIYALNHLIDDLEIHVYNKFEDKYFSFNIEISDIYIPYYVEFN